LLQWVADFLATAVFDLSYVIAQFSISAVGSFSYKALSLCSLNLFERWHCGLSAQCCVHRIASKSPEGLFAEHGPDPDVDHGHLVIAVVAIAMIEFLGLNVSRMGLSTLQVSIPGQSPRIAIVSEHASAEFGGEAALPLHYFRVLRRRGHMVWLVVHERTRAELSALFPGDENILYVRDTEFHRTMDRYGNKLPARVGHATTGYALRLSSQLAQRRLVRRLVQKERIDVVHQPMPVSPREPSVMYDLDAAVVIGPMNGAMDYPSAFAHLENKLVTRLLGFGRIASGLLNRLMPGKLKSAVLLVANDRTRNALPSGTRGQIIHEVENGVDLSMWITSPEVSVPAQANCCRLLFMGRLVDWKGVDMLLIAFSKAAKHQRICLSIVGNGLERHMLVARAKRLGILGNAEAEPGKVYFAGWRSQRECAQFLNRCDVLVLPSVLECGGAVVLEAMASSRAVIAANWGGPADYLDPSCGILVAPTSQEAFVDGLEEAICILASSPGKRIEMGRAGRRKAVRDFDWEVKVDRMLNVYRDAIIDRQLFLPLESAC